VLLVGSKGDLYTEGYAHNGKVQLCPIDQGKPNLARASWAHWDRFGHSRRYLNWNPWFYEGRSLEADCYDVPIPRSPKEENGPFAGLAGVLEPDTLYP
jgi:hypothetical protein